METITNLANTAVGTASKLIYGDQTTKTEEAVDATKNNETAGKEPVSGVEGKGTATQPFDQGNARKSPHSWSMLQKRLDISHAARRGGQSVVVTRRYCNHFVLRRLRGPVSGFCCDRTTRNLLIPLRSHPSSRC
jgi:hypothetical protein